MVTYNFTHMIFIYLFNFIITSIEKKIHATGYKYVHSIQTLIQPHNKPAIVKAVTFFILLLIVVKIMKIFTYIIYIKGSLHTF